MIGLRELSGIFFMLTSCFKGGQIWLLVQNDKAICKPFLELLNLLRWEWRCANRVYSLTFSSKDGMDSPLQLGGSLGIDQECIFIYGSRFFPCYQPDF